MIYIISIPSFINAPLIVFEILQVFFFIPPPPRLPTQPIQNNPDRIGLKSLTVGRLNFDLYTIDACV